MTHFLQEVTFIACKDQQESRAGVYWAIHYKFENLSNSAHQTFSIQTYNEDSSEQLLENEVKYVRKCLSATCIFINQSQSLLQLHFYQV